jgi:hypothetical protein
LRPTSRLTVDADRPNRRAINRNDSPARTPHAISSRSRRDKHLPDPARSNHDRCCATATRCTDLREHPTRTATTPTGTRSRSNRRISRRVAPDNGRPGNPTSLIPASPSIATMMQRPLETTRRAGV